MSSGNQPKTLAIIGAGPKALAIAAKLKVLTDLQAQNPAKAAAVSVPHLLVIEKNTVGAHWDGSFGFTDGMQTLGTPPEKDVGFPYNSLNTPAEKATWGRLTDDVNIAMLGYSWQSFKIRKHTYGEWIDKGRPHPNHREWSRYYKWVAGQVGLSAKRPLPGRDYRDRTTVTQLGIADGRWLLTCIGPGQQDIRLQADGLVITGPGAPWAPFFNDEHPRIFDGRDFWTRFRQFDDPAFADRVAVIGTGETAASVVAALLDRIGNRKGTVIAFISRSGFIHSRGESYLENEVFTSPDKNWRELPLQSRKDFIGRTDRGVISPKALEGISTSNVVRRLFGEVETIDPHPDRVVVRLRPTAGGAKEKVYHAVVDARGFDSLSFVQKLFDGPTRDAFQKHVLETVDQSMRASLREKRRGKPAKNETYRELIEVIPHLIDADLSVRGLSPYLHLPMSAGLEQGPGFPNLSCLGTLSDRILRPYVTGLPGASSSS